MPINSLFEVLDTKNEVLKQLNLVSEFSDCQMRSLFITQKRKREVVQIISKHPTVEQTIHPQPKPNTKNSTHMSWISHASWL
jgi:ribulose bisphosphate carboxylase small subunit